MWLLKNIKLLNITKDIDSQIDTKLVIISGEREGEEQDRFRSTNYCGK